MFLSLTRVNEQNCQNKYIFLANFLATLKKFGYRSHNNTLYFNNFPKAILLIC